MMKRCVLFFIVLVSTLVLAAITDDDRLLVKKDVLVKNNMQTDVNIVGHKTSPNPDY